LADCGDRLFANYAKTENTKHQFCFEAVNPCTAFPFGVKTTYRAYSADEVIEILQPEEPKDGQIQQQQVVINFNRYIIAMKHM
jgi:hypothetical protein